MGEAGAVVDADAVSQNGAGEVAEYPVEADEDESPEVDESADADDEEV